MFHSCFCHLPHNPTCILSRYYECRMRAHAPSGTRGGAHEGKGEVRRAPSTAQTIGYAQTIGSVHCRGRPWRRAWSRGGPADGAQPVAPVPATASGPERRHAGIDARSGPAQSAPMVQPKLNSPQSPRLCMFLIQFFTSGFSTGVRHRTIAAPHRCGARVGTAPAGAAIAEVLAASATEAKKCIT